MWVFVAGLLLLFGLAGCNADGCAEGSIDCNGQCVAVVSDDKNCGACGVACEAGSFCNAGACEAFCGVGKADCGGTCTGVVSDASNCGACGVTCPAGQFCDAGACSATCSGVLCPGPTGTSECARLTDDPDHCGACGVVCGAGQECSAGKCVTSCPAGRTLCGSECVDLATSVTHCGVCGNACDGGVSCTAGSCGGTSGCVGPDCPCPEGQTRCGSACIDTTVNTFHCGACDAACADTQSCSSGACACPNGGTLCNGSCIDAQSDNANCGACGNLCTDGKTCQAGTCTCTEAGTTDCNGQCVNLQGSTQHCGACGNACVGLETCDDGTCFYDVGDDCGGAAKNVSVTKVALYQAVETNLFDAGQTVAASQRAVDVIQGKQAVVRVHLDVGAGFAAREISARVYLDNGDVQPEAFFAKRSISTDSTQENLDSTLNVTLPADKIQAGTKYYVELVECGSAGSGSVGTTRIPASGSTNLEARQTGAIRIAFLPFRYNGFVPDTSATVIQRYADEVKKQYGTTEVITSVLPAFGDYTGTPTLSALLNDVRNKRQQDAPDGKVYYYGLVRSTSTFGQFCSGGCTTGVAYVSTGNPAYRTGIGIGYGEGESAHTLAHELGHNHGRDHAPCGTSGDANFPHAGASIGVWGLDLTAAQLKNPAQYKDFMSYCGPSWISDYNYNAMTDEVAATNGAPNSFEIGNGAALERWDALTVTSAGPSWTFPQDVDPSSTDGRVPAVVFDASGNELLQIDAFKIDLSEGHGYLLVVPPRRSGWYAIGLSGDVALPYP